MTLYAPPPATLSLGGLVWPVTYRFTVEAPWGRSRCELTVEVPALAGLPDETRALGPLLWSRSIALATANDARLLSYETMTWKTAQVALDQAPGGTDGRAPGPSGPRASCAVFMPHTGHTDGARARRLIVAGTPASWFEHRLLNDAGARGLEGAGRVMNLGLGATLLGGPLVWLIAYPGGLPRDLTDPFGVVFRRVLYLWAARYAERAPDLSQEPWPL